MPGKTHKVVVLGAKGTGKTSIIEQVIYGNHILGVSLPTTIEDIYVASVLPERNSNPSQGPDHMRFYDTAGVDTKKPNVPKLYYTLADAYILVYDITVWDTFHCLNAIKADIEKHKEKKDAPPILVLGNKCDLEAKSRQIDIDTVQRWASKEKVNLKEVTVVNRKGLMDAISWLTAKLTPVPQRTGLSIKKHFTKSSGAAAGLSAMGPAADV